MTPYSVDLSIRRVAAQSGVPQEPGETHESPAEPRPSETPARFEAQWIESGSQPSGWFPLTPPLTDDDASELRWYLEEFHRFVGDGTLARANKIENRINDWGKALFDALFGTPDGINVYRNMMDAEERGVPILLTLGTEEPNILVQPWELMNDGMGPLALRGVSIRRQLVGAKPAARTEIRLPLRVLVIVARPEDSGFIDPRTSVRPVLDALDLLPRGAVKAEFCEPPTLAELERRVSKARKQRKPFHIVHFDGHGAYLPRTGVGALCFEDENRKTDFVAGARLGTLISRRRVPLMILEACNTAGISDRPVFGSVAPALLGAGVASVVAFSHAVHIETATMLVERLYSELVEGLSIGEALSEARACLQANPNRWLALGPNPPTVKLQDWFIPQLYQVGPDLRLLAEGEDLAKVVEDAATIPDWRSKLHGFPPEPQYRFQGRARELLELGRAFEKHVAVVVAGMGGMGKTALSREAAAWWLRAGRFETAIFCSFEQIRNVDRVVELVGQAVEGMDFSRRSPEEQRAVVLRLFRERRLLVVWDNFESVLPQYQPRAEGADGSASVGTIEGFDEGERIRLREFYSELVEGKPAGRLLVTCRPDDTGLPYIKQHHLKGLARHDSLHLLTSLADLLGFSLDREGYGRGKIEKLLDALQDHPLSISLVAPHLALLTPEAIQTDFVSHLDRFRNEGAEVDRNKSLVASLAFSASQLSDKARAVLPYLAWFRGGAFEASIRGFAELEPEPWSRIRQELEATALVRVEDLSRFNNPFIRFHPTLPYAARADEVPDCEAAEERFLRVYAGVSREVYDALFGQTAGAAMELMGREEGNVRAAIDLAFRWGNHQTGWHIADTLQTFLEMAGRRRERDKLASQVRGWIPEGAPLNQATCASIWNHAETLLAEGKVDKAVESLEQLARRLETEDQPDEITSTLLLGLTYNRLAKILDSARRAEPALDACLRALANFAQPTTDDGQAHRSSVLGTQANVLMSLGRHDEALNAAEQGLEIDERLGRHRNAAASHARCAQILTQQGRYSAADVCYDKALELARRVNDLELQGATLQSQGILSHSRGDLARSVQLYQESVGYFQQANDRINEMGAYNQLGIAERDRGHLDAAEAWFARSRRLAEDLGTQAQLAAILQNIGGLDQVRAQQTDDTAESDALLERAATATEESLKIKLERGDAPGAAISHFQLGTIFLMLKDLDRAEKLLLKSLEFYEPRRLPDLWKVYAQLSNLANDRGDANTAAEWAAKRDAMLEEVRRRATEGGGPARLPEQAAKAFLALAQTIFSVRAQEGELPPQVAEMLAQLDGQGEPLASASGFLRALAEGGLPAVPSGLPEPLPEIFEGLLEALK